MGTDDLFKKKHAQLEARKKEFRTPKPNSFLIVTEGSRTEPYYFDGLAKHINDRYGKGIDVERPLIETHGEGRGTSNLVEAASQIVARANIIYNQIWVVFDKDDFIDFDDAISLAEHRDYRVAWSNQSFEYWIYLHFNYSDAALHRQLWVKKLDELFKKMEIDQDGYKKNNPDLFELITTHGSLKSAVNSAMRIEKTYRSISPSQCDPCTTVHHLILELKPWLDSLL